MRKEHARPTLKYLLCIILAATGLSIHPAHAAEADHAADAQPASEADRTQDSTDEAAVEQETAAGEPQPEFPCSFNDVAHNLVIIECESSIGKWSGSGFVAEMDGKTYIFTNQHVIMGADAIDFATATGEKLRPMGVELSLTRDIARLPIADRNDALSISKEVLMGMRLGVFGNSEGGGVATELYGKVTGVGAELVEVSAEFVSGNSGSPVINADQEAIGIASYVSFSRPNRSTENTQFEDKTRRFCYRLTNVRWTPVRWKQYNGKYGKTYRETEIVYDSVLNLLKGFFDQPFSTVTENYLDSELSRWSGQHNRAVDSSKNQRRIEVGKSAEALSGYCKRRARNLQLTLDSQDLTGFLREELESYMYSFEYLSEVADYFKTSLPAM